MVNKSGDTLDTGRNERGSIVVKGVAVLGGFAVAAGLFASGYLIGDRNAKPGGKAGKQFDVLYKETKTFCNTEAEYALDKAYPIDNSTGPKPKEGGVSDAAYEAWYKAKYDAWHTRNEKSAGFITQHVNECMVTNLIGHIPRSDFIVTSNTSANR